MKYAVIADVHGNAPALHLAMADALDRGAQGFLFAGDYCIRAPWPNEVVALLRGAPQRVAIRGNEERYLHVPDGDDGQFAVSRWARATGLYREAPVWSEIVFGEWRSGRELAMYFLRYAEAFAKRVGDPVRPFSRDTWNAAFRAWRREPDPRMMVSDADFPR